VTNLLDPRLHAYRPDLAEARLRGQVEAERFVEGEPAGVAVGWADLKRRPEPAAPNDSQLLFGEAVSLFERRGGWAWVRNTTDGYVGWIAEAALGAAPPPASHRVAALRTPRLPGPDLKLPPLDFLSFGAPVTPGESRGAYVELAGGGWVFARHLAERGMLEADYVATARRFLGTPYLWGGRSSLGLDCSALVQLALAAAGVAAPRDSDQQEQAELGVPLPPDSPRRRGDLLFWQGHVALALDAERVVHATGGPMLTLEEPFAAIDGRARAESGSGLRLIRRL